MLARVSLLLVALVHASHAAAQPAQRPPRDSSARTTVAGTATIRGSVLDETGDPIEGVEVFAVRSMFRDGRRQLVPIGGPFNRTDEAGEYRLRGLAPGTYYVTGLTHETWTVTRDGLKQVMGYSPTYFPGTTHVSEARRVTVRVGEQVSNADLALVPGRAARLSGT